MERTGDNNTLSMQKPVVFFDEVVATTIGTGTTETRLNTDTPLVCPDTARKLIEITPWMVSNGLITANQSYLAQMRIQSDDVAVEPKSFMLDPIESVLSTIGSALVPMLHARRLNVSLRGSERINYRATAQVANTVAPLVGADVTYANVDTGGLEQFYSMPLNETDTGTTVNTRTAGNTITITGGREITDLYGAVVNTTLTVCESVCGTFAFESPDFQTNSPYRISVQPISSVLGATVGMLLIALTKRHFPMGMGIPISRNTTINTFYTNRVLFTTAGDFITGVGWVK